jgi:hypothetical protein
LLALIQLEEPARQSAAEKAGSRPGDRQTFIADPGVDKQLLVRDATKVRRL